MKQSIIRYLETKVNSLVGKTIVVTGANSGLGFSITKECAFKGALVVMACRSLERALKAKEMIINEVPAAQLEIIIYDQSSFNSIKQFSQQLEEKYPLIDAFIFNAGIYSPKKEYKTKEGFDLTIGTNYLGAYYLTRVLQAYFAKQKQLQVIYVGSLVHMLNPNFKNFKKNCYQSKLSRNRKYQLSKAAIMTFAVQQAKETTSYNVSLFHPGITDTNIISSQESSFSLLLKKLGHGFLKVFCHTPDKAVLGVLRILSLDENMQYYAPRGPFHIFGYPKKLLIPKKLLKSNDELFLDTKEVLKDYLA